MFIETVFSIYFIEIQFLTQYKVYKYIVLNKWTLKIVLDYNLHVLFFEKLIRASAGNLWTTLKMNPAKY